MEWLAYGIIGGLALAPIVRAVRVRCWWGVLVMAAVVMVSLPGWTTTPDGVLQDTLEYAPRVQRTWEGLFGAWQCTHVLGWAVLPLSVAHQWMGTWLVERAVGLVWHCLFVLALCVWPLGWMVELPIIVAVTSATRFGLWTQRHHVGSDVLLQQALLVICLLRGQVFGAGVLTALMQYNYPALHASIFYPMILLGAHRKTVVVYAVAAVLCLPLLWTLQPDVYRLNADVSLMGLWTRALNIIYAFGDPFYSQDASWLWSYPGAQLLPPVACAAIVIGIMGAVQSVDGWRWVLLAVVGCLPSLAGDTVGAASHREILALLPLSVLAAYPLRFLPDARTAWKVSAALAAAMATQGLLEWQDPAFWLPWNHGGPHGF